MSAPSRTTVGALLVNGDDQVLFGLRASWKSAWPDHWDAIGGHVEEGEDLAAAMIREVEEEIGVTPAAFEWIESVFDVHDQHPCHLYVVTAWTGGSPSNVSDEHSELRWFSLDELAALPNLAGEGYPRLAGIALDRSRRATK